MSVKLSRAAYAGHYGPTTGDRIRLADTELIIEIEKDFTTYGEEVQFGGGKVIRDGQGQSPLPEPPAGEPPAPRRSTSSSPTPSSWTTRGSSRATSASATGASSASARRATRSFSPASIRTW